MTFWERYKFRIISIGIGLIIAFILAFGRAYGQTSKQYQIVRRCADDCRDATGYVVITEKHIFIKCIFFVEKQKRDVRYQLLIEKKFRDNGKEFYHIQGRGYRGIVIVSDAGATLELVVGKEHHNFKFYFNN
jgi:hypothetical protein